MPKIQIVHYLLILTTLFTIACASDMADTEVESEDIAFTLQLLHFSDIDGNEETALAAVDEFSALVNGFKTDPMYGSATLLVSSGDNIIPGPRFYAAEQRAVRAVTGSNEPGHTDIAFLNYMGVAASAIGNHDLDAGPGELVDAMQIEDKDGVEFPGAQFPYLGANLDWSSDDDTNGSMGQNGDMVGNLMGKFAASAVVEVAGEKIGLVGATTPLLTTITSSGSIVVRPEDRNSMPALAAEIQPFVDELTSMGINKIILLTHMQQIQIEKELSSLLKDVDIIVAGGSNTRMGDANDSLFPGDSEFEDVYPFESVDMDGNPTLVVNVDGDYKYLGRLIVSFDSGGRILTGSLDENLNGVWASTEDNVAMLGSEPIEELVVLRDAIQDVITAQYGNVIGYTDVYLDGRRSQVRTQETNLGNLTADANLWYANLMSDEAVDISLKNGGGLRTEIGSAIVPPGSTDYNDALLSPPLSNKEAGTTDGAVTEGHLRATLRFDNGLTTLSVTAEELKMLMEHAVSETMEGRTPGKFPQISGMSIMFDTSKPAGERIMSLVILDNKDVPKTTVVDKGQVQGDPNKRFRLVTLNFLAQGGDDYPFDTLSDPDRRNLYEGKGYGEDIDYPDENLAADPGMNSSFSYTGGEQDALAEYMMAFHQTQQKAFAKAEVPRNKDRRIQY